MTATELGNRPASDLPPMLRPDRTLYGDHRTIDGHYFTSAKMREYGKLCIAQERERCARIARGVNLNDEEAYYGGKIADAILAREAQEAGDAP